MVLGWQECHGIQWHLCRKTKSSQCYDIPNLSQLWPFNLNFDMYMYIRNRIASQAHLLGGQGNRKSWEAEISRKITKIEIRKMGRKYFVGLCTGYSLIYVVYLHFERFSLFVFSIPEICENSVNFSEFVFISQFRQLKM